MPSLRGNCISSSKQATSSSMNTTFHEHLQQQVHFYMTVGQQSQNRHSLQHTACSFHLCNDPRHLLFNKHGCLSCVEAHLHAPCTNMLAVQLPPSVCLPACRV
jgi:hypothetical protein